MSQSSGEKTEKPTSKRLRDLRKKGQISKSREVVSAGCIVCTFALLWASSHYIFRHLKNMLFFPVQYFDKPFREAFPDVLFGTGIEFLLICMPLMGLVFVMAILGNILQFGVLFSIEPIKPNASKINPVEGFKKIFNLSTLIELVKSIIKIIFIIIVVYYIIKNSLPMLVSIPQIGAEAILAALKSILQKLIAFSCAAFIVVAIGDFFFQKYYFIRKNRMTKDEVKRDHKEQEGDPIIKGNRKKMHRELATSNAAQGAKKASVVVTNPTHFAVGIYYKKGITNVPVITVKGKDYLARVIRKTAEAEAIPVIENVALARKLYNTVEEGQFIPRSLYKPVAEILKWAERISKGEQNG
ncbi:MAG: EscU/YscU/HrcU family type III secretion system export apparatus switch protein [Desulfobacteraceae bacterium]|nr:EscU/YscU/HrcU family type III secretion system export apparatus switch protein [Desulfobacteraceae bacterium]